MNTNNSSIASGAARHAMTFGGGAGAMGLQDDILQLLSMIVAVIGFAWSVYEKMSAARAKSREQDSGNQP